MDQAVMAVDAGQGHTCAITADGRLWCWGRNSESELGLGGDNVDIQYRRPMRVGSATDWTLVRGGQHTTCGVRAGAAYCWGKSLTDDDVVGVDMGIPGVPAGMTVSTPRDIGVPGVVTDLSFNTFGGAALDDKEGAWVWGRNREGQLGLGDTTPRTDGVHQAAGSGWTQVSAGRFATCGVREGRLVCAGKNDVGQLGQGNLTDSNKFLVVPLPSQ
jgi:alpha-tubulin suppressor-like RCC1 family protein